MKVNLHAFFVMWLGFFIAVVLTLGLVVATAFSVVWLMQHGFWYLGLVVVLLVFTGVPAYMIVSEDRNL